MKLTYDRDRNIAYLRLRPTRSEVETIRVSDELNVDIAPDGSVYGIELLNANEQLRAGDDGKVPAGPRLKAGPNLDPLSLPVAGRPRGGDRFNTRPRAKLPRRHGFDYAKSCAGDPQFMTPQTC